MTSPDFSFEKRFWKKGRKLIIGLDEVGRGAFAGPVVTGGVIFKKGVDIGKLKDNGVKIDDSKKLTAKQRERADEWIKDNCLCCSVSVISAKKINRVGISKATHSGFRRVVANMQNRLDRRVDFILIDAFYIPYIRGFPKGTKRVQSGWGANTRKTKQLAIVNGDQKSFSIAAASIIAKVARDKLMAKLGESPRYRKFKWKKNKGYGTSEHRVAILKYGQTGYHRKKFVETFLSKLNRKQETL